MHKFTISLSDNDVKKIGEYMVLADIKTIEEAIYVLAMVRLDLRLEQLMGKGERKGSD